MEGKLDYFVATVGTGGTITGCSKILKEKIKDVKIVGVDPIGSSLALPESLNVEEGKMYRIEGTG
jgi:cystathionine beta-synthase